MSFAPFSQIGKRGVACHQSPIWFACPNLNGQLPRACCANRDSAQVLVSKNDQPRQMAAVKRSQIHLRRHSQSVAKVCQLAETMLPADEFQQQLVALLFVCRPPIVANFCLCVFF